MNHTPEEASNTIKNIIDEIKSVEGTFYSIWHNNNLCNSMGWEKWTEVYEDMLEYANSLKNKQLNNK